MAALISYTDFIGDIYIPTNETVTLARLNEYLQPTEDEVLEALLGVKLWKAFIAALSGTPAAKWTNLRDGVIWTDADGVQHNFKGIKYILKYITYYYFLRDNQNFVTGVGVSEAKIDNANLISTRFKVVRTYNNAILQRNYCNDYIEYQNSLDATTYPDYIFTEWNRINELSI